jgi:glycosyltransferase involved in cell wall biosynthesis
MEGLGWYTYEIVKRLCVNHPEHEFIFLFDRKYDEGFVFSNNVTPVVLFPQARHPILFYLWFEWAVPYALKKYRADLFFSPDGFACLSTDVPQIITIHDLNFEHYPNDVKKFDSIYYRHFFKRFAQKAKHIFTISDFSKNDIAATYHINPEKISRVYNGANPHLQPLSENEKLNVKRTLTNGNDYLIYIGALHPRKNISGMLKAFELFKQTDKQNIQLVIVGDNYFWNNEMKTVWKNLSCKNDIIFTGHLNAQNLKNTLGAARALLYLSYFEGFGLPIIEAMQCGVPVITSNLTSMPEIAGDAALLTNPFSIENIADAMQQIISNHALSQQLIKKGYLHAKNFSWDDSAENIWKIIEKQCLHA